MVRLTERDAEGSARWSCKAFELGNDAGFVIRGVLADYEDTGLTAHEIVELVKESRPKPGDVVHCKDCKFLEFHGPYGECAKGCIGIVGPEDYCSRGFPEEKKEEALKDGKGD